MEVRKRKLTWGRENQLGGENFGAEKRAEKILGRGRGKLKCPIWMCLASS
jgi:hypothetical protein